MWMIWKVRVKRIGGGRGKGGHSLGFELGAVERVDPVLAGIVTCRAHVPTIMR